MKVREENMKQAAENDYSNATQLANYLVSLGIPFRKAHELTGMLVLEAIQQKKWLHTLPIEIYQNVEPRITEDLYKQLTVEAVVESHRAEGGTSMSSLTLQLAQAKEILKTMDAWLDEKKIMKAQE
jgi:argininosuccinate lyase